MTPPSLSAATAPLASIRPSSVRTVLRLQPQRSLMSSAASRPVSSLRSHSASMTLHSASVRLVPGMVVSSIVYVCKLSLTLAFTFVNSSAVIIPTHVCAILGPREGLT